VIGAQNIAAKNILILLDNICALGEKFRQQLPSWVTGFALE
jgi:hypothetical protein